MGLFKAMITFILSIMLVNHIYKNKTNYYKYPLFRFIFPYIDHHKSNLIIGCMMIIMIIW